MTDLKKPKCILLMGRAGAGKDTVGEYLQDRHGYCVRSFASPIKASLNRLLMAAGAHDEELFYYSCDREGKEEPCPYFMGKSYRQAAQTLGTEWGRKFIHPDLWALTAIKQAKELPENGLIVFTDTRFPNEVLAARAAFDDAKLVNVSRPGLLPVSAHVSEESLHNEHIDYEIENDAELEDLKVKIDKMMDSFQR